MASTRMSSKNRYFNKGCFCLIMAFLWQMAYFDALKVSQLHWSVVNSYSSTILYVEDSKHTWMDINKGF